MFDTSFIRKWTWVLAAQLPHPLVLHLGSHRGRLQLLHLPLQLADVRGVVVSLLHSSYTPRLTPQREIILSNYQKMKTYLCGWRTRACCSVWRRGSPILFATPHQPGWEILMTTFYINRLEPPNNVTFWFLRRFLEIPLSYIFLIAVCQIIRQVYIFSSPPSSARPEVFARPPPRKHSSPPLCLVPECTRGTLAT